MAEQLTSEIQHSEEQVEALARLEKAAAAKGIKPLDFDSLLARADFWPEDESADDFIAAIEEWRRDESSREMP